MPIEMPKGFPFSVDTWSPSSMEKRHHFLTHAHRDHSVGISTNSSFPIYCTRFTKTLLRRQFPQLDDLLFVDIEVGQSVVIKDPDGDFTVTVFDANHCPGAVMFLFEGEFGNILHTGDCRLTPECLRHLPEKYRGKNGKEPRCPLDFVYLDCTFARFFQQFPSTHSAIHQVINCIWKHPEAPLVYLSCNLLGQEEILRCVSQTFGSKIYVDESTNPECFQTLSLAVPGILSHDSSSRFHLLNEFPLNGIAKLILEEARASFLPEPLIIRPSTQWYVHDEGFLEVGKTRKQIISEAIRDRFGIWHVCYSMHSSRDELEWALQILAPKWVISTTSCSRAMELDYVKKQSLGVKVGSDNPIWKILGISMEDSTNEDDASEVRGVSCAPVVEEPDRTYVEPHVQQLKTCVGMKELLHVLPSSKSPVTLFGRARLGVEDIRLSQVQVVSISSSSPEKQVGNEVVDVSIHKENCKAKKEELPENTRREIGIPKVEFEKSAADENIVVCNCRSSRFTSGSPKGFSERFRKLYRSMNVPVPEPLPSLVELLKSRRSAKRRFEFYL